MSIRSTNTVSESTVADSLTVSLKVKEMWNTGWGEV